MKKLIDEIDKYVKKVPALPKNIKDLLVQFAPWAAILTIVLSIPALLAVLDAGSYYSTYGMIGGYGARGGFFASWGIRYTLMVVFLVANLVLRGLSIKGLLAKTIQGWNFLFYSVLLYFVYAIFTFDIIGGIISTAISLYLIFQIRESYK
jgi:hypothetical protein